MNVKVDNQESKFINTKQMEFDRSELLKLLPESLKKIVLNGTFHQISIGMSQSNVYKISTEDQAFVFKIQMKSPHRRLKHEVCVLNWLEHRLSVPKVIEFIQNSTYEFLLLTEIDGRNCAEELEFSTPEDIVMLMADGLKNVHSIPIKDCPFDERINQKLILAKNNIINGLIDETDFDHERMGMTSEEVYKAIVESDAPSEDLVFTHGDYCLPNIMLSDSVVSGFVDLGKAGIADRYQDLSLCSRSIGFNMGNDYVNMFFIYYGIEEPDIGKIKYFCMLDEFF